MAEKEHWRPAVGFEGYEVSDFGQVRSYWQKYTGVLMDKPQRILSHRNKTKYASVQLIRSGKGYQRRVHRLVMEAFVGPRPDGLEICHNDENGHNNRLENLRYDTHSSNMQQAKERLGGPRLFNKEEVCEIRERRQAGEMLKSIAGEYQCSTSAINNLCLGHTYKSYDGPIGSCRIADRAIREMRRLRWNDGLALYALAEKYGMTEGGISRIVNFKSRINAGGQLPPST